MLRLGPRSSCREGFKKMDILTIPFLYIYVLILFAINLNIYQTNSSLHDINTVPQNKLHKTSVRLASYREVSTIHLLKYLTSYHKMCSNIVTSYIPLRLC